MMENKYLSEYIGKQVDAAIRKTLNLDSLATENSFNLIHSDGVWRSIKRFYDQLNQEINVIDGKVSGTISGITSKMVTDALGFTPYNSANFTKDNIKSTLGIADWALNSTKPSYSFSEITGVAAFNQLPTLYWANVALSDASNENTEPTFKSIKIGGGKISWNADGYFEFDNGVVSQSFISAFGVGQGGSEEVSGVSSIKYNSQTFRAVDGVIDISQINISGGVSSWNDLTDKPSWIGATKPSYNFSEIGSKPTTISGYGITDAITISNIGEQSVDSSMRINGSLIADLNTPTWNKDNVNVTINSYGRDAQNRPSTFSNANVVINLGLTKHGTNGMYGQQIAIDNQGLIYTRNWTAGYIYSWKTIAFTSSNVASATKLQTARTIWGKSFDGTANVSGQMTDVGHIYSVQHKTYDIGSNTNSWRYGYFKWVGSSGGESFGLGANNSTHMTITTTGNVGFGNTDPSYRIHANGHIYTNGLFLADNISYENNAFVNRGLRCGSGYGSYSFFGNYPIIMSSKDSDGYSHLMFGNYAYNSNEWVLFRHKLNGNNNLLNISSADGSKFTLVGINATVSDPPSEALDVRGNAKANSFVVNPWANGATFAANGWYKIGRMARTDTYSNSAIIFIGRAYNYINNENYVISVNSTYSACTITQISGIAHSRLIDKVGIIGHAGTSGADVYIHINGSTTANQYYISSVGQFNPCTPTLENVTPSTTINTINGCSVNGNIVATSEITAYSDARLKTDIKDLDFRGALMPKSFVKDGKKSIGFIAQEVRELYPELVLGEETEDSYLSINYGAITAVLACQTNDHEKRIAELERENRELKKKLNI